jgi:hypothetical protein
MLPFPVLVGYTIALEFCLMFLRGEFWRVELSAADDPC